MRKKNLKALKLEKITIAQLDVKSKQQILGGGITSYVGITCVVRTCKHH